MKRFLNPYNFVRPLPKPNIDDLNAENAERYLMWRCAPPPHDRYTGFSGRIVCKMTAKTPIFVTDSPHVDSSTVNNKEHKTYQFFQVNGEDMIPASGLRGSIRSVFEAITNSTWSVFKDAQLSYRAVGDVLGFIPARLDYQRNPTTGQVEWRAILLTGTSRVNYDNGCRADGKMYAAWLPLDRTNGYTHGQVCYAALMAGRNNNWIVIELAPLVMPDGTRGDNALKSAYPRAQIHQGVAMLTGNNFPEGRNPKRNERFFFRAEQTKEYPVSQKVIDRYNGSLMHMREFHQEAIQKKTPHLSRFLTNPIEMERIDENNPLIKATDCRFPIYVLLRQGDSDEFEVDALAPVAVPRLPEKRTLVEVLEDEGYDHLLPATSYDKLSPADRLFGWVHTDADDLKQKNRDERVAYKGRVRFSNARVTHSTGKLPDMTLSILGAPKPTTTRFYVNWRYKNKQGKFVDGVKPEMGDERHGERKKLSDEDLRYGKPGNMLRGRKFYRRHPSLNEYEARSGVKSDQNRTIRGAHQAGTTYAFTVDFENLQPVELGALLWTLRLNDIFDYGEMKVPFDGVHRLGYGKPLGFGSVKIEIESLIMSDPSVRYSDPDMLAGAYDQIEAVNNYCEHFKQVLSQLYNKEFQRLVNVIDLCTLLSEIPLAAGISIHYPRARYRRTDQDKNFEWFRDNKRVGKGNAPQLVLPYSTGDDIGFPYLRWNNQTQTVQITEE